jgi:hypothetical protein
MQFFWIRVHRHLLRLRPGLALVILALAIAMDAAAQTRPVALPPNAVYGELKAFDYPMAKIGDRSLRLSPGARIFDTQNLIIQPVAAPQQASVMYRLDINGNVSDIWLLTPEEAAQARKRKAQGQ